MRVGDEPPTGEIEAKVAAAGYSATAETNKVSAGESVLDRQDARRNLLWVVAAAIGAAVVMYLQDGDSASARIATLALATLLMFTAGLTFYRGAWIAARNRTANMDTLVALGISAAYFYSICTTFPDFFRGAAILRYRDRADSVHSLRQIARGARSRPCDGGIAIPAQPRARRGDRAARRQGIRRPRRGACVGDVVVVKPAHEFRSTASLSQVPARSTSRCLPANRCRSRNRRAPKSRAGRLTPRRRLRFERHGLALTLRWPRSSEWWRTRRPIRLLFSAWRTRWQRDSCPR